MNNPISVNDFKLISLCNVIYKIISKVLANRLKKVLHDIISSTQSAFIPGRLITDNIMVAFVVLHTMKTKQKGGIGNKALKLDMSKAYDKIEWRYLEVIMKKMGFEEKLIKLIMRCVNSVSYSVLVNGRLSEKIYPTRRLRQGEPLSPYLFILCAEGLSSLLQSSVSKGDIKGWLARGGPRINHLFVC